MINIAFFEDHPMIQQSLKKLIGFRYYFHLVFGVSNKVDLILTLKQHLNIDVIIVDLISNDVQGLEVYEYVAKFYPNIKIVAYTSLSSPILIENLLSVGVKGYVNKNQNIDDLIEAIESAYDDVIYLPKEYGFLKERHIRDVTILLTNREIEIMKFIINEYTTIDIAERLGLSINTVENHRKNIFRKLDVKNVAGMVREASKLGFID